MKNVWKSIALQKQLQFKQQLGLTQSGTFKNKEYPQILADTDASFGANYYCFNNAAEWQELLHWALIQNNKNVDFEGIGLKNMLRSEHIPYNLFFPLQKLRNNNPQLLNSFLEQLFNNAIKVDVVTDIKIEYAGVTPKSNLLDDLTSFDAYIAYTSNGKKCGLGIEVKYTEQSYPYGKTEKDRMFGTKKGEYIPLTNRCAYYIPEAMLRLRKPKLKQPWRNHLLGVKMVEMGELQQFHSVHLYPEGNTYQTEVCKCYSNCLTEENKNSFQPITFEKWIEVAEQVLCENEYIKRIDWINYLKNRY